MGCSDTMRRREHSSHQQPQAHENICGNGGSHRKGLPHEMKF